MKSKSKLVDYFNCCILFIALKVGTSQIQSAVNNKNIVYPC